MAVNANSITDRLTAVLSQLQAGPGPREAKRRPGRPSRHHIRRTFKRLDLYLEPQLFDALGEIAEELGPKVSRSDLVRRAVEDFVEAHWSPA
jgi:hypothetical protein